MSFDTILFVFGPARGGTTFVGNFLQDWFDYTMGPEGSFILSFHERLTHYRPLEREANFYRLLDDLARCEMLEIMRSKWPESDRVDISAPMLRRHARRRDYAGAVYAVFDAIRAATGKQRLGVKFPDYWQALPLLRDLFPGTARFLWVLRDGRDVALSNYGVPWGLRSAYACARQWRRMTETVESFAHSRPPPPLVTIRYEDLLRDPGVFVPELACKLDIDLNRTAVDAAIAALERNPMRYNFDKWKSRMPPEDVRIYEAVAGGALERLGYERTQAAPTVSVLECARFEAAEFFRKVRVTIRKDVLGRTDS